MKSSDDIVMSYLFGELTEAESTELEAQYFNDPQAFDRLVRIENELVDSYARGKLTAQTRERFERAYLSDQNLRARLKFGEAFAHKLDQREQSALPAVNVSTWRERLFSSLTLQRPVLALSMGLALLLLTSGLVWLLVQSSRLKNELAQIEALQTSRKQHEAELQQQLAEQQKRNQELTQDLQRASDLLTTETVPPAGPPSSFVTLLLTATGVRGVEPASPPTLVIPKGTEEVHVHLNLKAQDYQNYQITLRAIGGPEIFTRRNVKPRIYKSGAIFSFSLPASKLSAGDYMLTLSSATQSGEFEDLTKSLFRVEKP